MIDAAYKDYQILAFYHAWRYNDLIQKDTSAITSTNAFLFIRW